MDSRPSTRDSRIKPSDLREHRQTHCILAPCCLCPLLEAGLPNLSNRSFTCLPAAHGQGFMWPPARGNGVLILVSDLYSGRVVVDSHCAGSGAGKLISCTGFADQNLQTKRYFQPRFSQNRMATYHAFLIAPIEEAPPLVLHPSENAQLRGRPLKRKYAVLGIFIR